MKITKKLSSLLIVLALSVMAMTGAALADEIDEIDVLPEETEEIVEVISEETEVDSEETESVPEEPEIIAEEAEVTIGEEETDPSETEEPDPTVAIIRASGAEDVSYTTLEAAISAAADNGGTVILTADYTLAEDTTIPTGVTVVVPYDATYSTGTQDYVKKATGTIGEAYVTLTVPTEKELVVNGTLLVNGVAAGDTQKHEGVLDGNYGHVDLDGTITVKGKLYARGIIDGDGSVTAERGSTVYQLFQIKDWRGGIKTAELITALLASRRVFPFNEYEVSNIQSAATYEYGSSMVGQGYVYANNSANFADINLIGSNALFIIQDENSNCTSTYDATANQLKVVCNGNVHISKLSVSVGGFTINSNNFVCPVSKHIGITANGTLTLEYNYKLLPGSYITVNSNAALTVSSGKSLYVYDAAHYQPGFTYGQTQAQIGPSAALTINGSVSGNVYSSDAGMSNITGSAYTAADSGSTATVREYTTEYVSVTFHRATLTAVTE